MTSQYILQRLAYMFLSFLGITIIAFTVFRVVPGDPALLLVGPAGTPADVERMRRFLGLDQPIYLQYGRWLQDLFLGDLGRSFRLGAPVLSILLDRLPATLELIVASVVAAFAIGVVMGVTAAVRQQGLLRYVASGASFIGFAVPNFLWALIFVIVFGAILRILPISGRIELGIPLTRITGLNLVDSLITGNGAGFVSSATHLILPVGALALGLIAVVHRTLHSSMLDVLQEDYIFTDRMKGLAESYIVYVRALKNALIPTITILGVQFTFLVGGSIIIELIFGWPGIGSLAFTAVQYRDLSLIQGIIVVYAIIVVVTNFLIDLTYSYLNPKIRFG